MARLLRGRSDAQEGPARGRHGAHPEDRRSRLSGQASAARSPGPPHPPSAL